MPLAQYKQVRLAICLEGMRVSRSRCNLAYCLSHPQDGTSTNMNNRDKNPRQVTKIHLSLVGGRSGSKILVLLAWVGLCIHTIILLLN